MKSVIIGAGTYGEVYLAYLQEAGIEIVGFLDDDPRYINQKVCGIPVLGGLDFLACLKDEYDVKAVYCPLGNNKLRVEILNRALGLGYEVPNFIHSTVDISPNVEIGKGVYILLGTHIMPYTKIKKLCNDKYGSKCCSSFYIARRYFSFYGSEFWGIDYCA